MAQGILSFGNGCYLPSKIISPEQTNMEPDKYTGETQVFTLTPWIIDPPECKINYECVSVER